MSPSGRTSAGGKRCVPFDARYGHIRDLLRENCSRYGKPLFIAETEIDVTEMEARIDLSHRADCDDAHPQKLTFHFAAAMLANGLRSTASPRPIGADTCERRFL